MERVQNATDEQLRERWVRAAQIGWYIKDNGYLKAPDHFECEQNYWAARYTAMTLNGAQVEVPHWFWDDAVLETGRWRR